MTVDAAEERLLDGEADQLARYLVGRSAPPELAARYRAANGAIWAGAPARREAALVDFVRRHPWSLPYLDAAAALVQPGGRLRGKVLVMAAVLETSPALAEEFLPRDVPRGRALAQLLGAGVAAVAQAAGGLLLYPLAVRGAA
jgi:hypothetical protein